MDQLLLIAHITKAEAIRLQVEAVSREQRRQALAKAAKPQRERVTSWQLDMLGEPTPVRRWVCVIRRKPGPTPKPRAVIADVFALALAPLRIAVGKGATERQVRRQVIQEDGITRVVTLREQDTPEWAERERQRRARQRPPRPTKGAKTRSKKLNDLIGEDE